MTGEKMINISANTLLVVHSDGRSMPFDADSLRSSILAAAPEVGDDTARDISLAIEFALKKQSRSTDSSEQSFMHTEIDSMIVSILSGVGMSGAAEKYRKSSTLKGDIYRIPINKMEFFIAENFGLSGETLKLIAAKVFNTVKAIGADSAEPALICELAKHFINLNAASGIPYTVVRPDFRSNTDFTVDISEIESLLPDDVTPFISKRIITLHSMDLRIFQALHADIRLNGIAENANLVPPMTELALAEHFMRTAQALDKICLAADEAARRKAFDIAIPLKLILHLSDASIFTRDKMACQTSSEQEICAAELCSMLSGMLTRRPIKFTSA